MRLLVLCFGLFVFFFCMVACSPEKKELSPEVKKLQEDVQQTRVSLDSLGEKIYRLEKQVQGLEGLPDKGGR